MLRARCWAAHLERRCNHPRGAESTLSAEPASLPVINMLIGSCILKRGGDAQLGGCPYANRECVRFNICFSPVASRVLRWTLEEPRTRRWHGADSIKAWPCKILWPRNGSNHSSKEKTAGDWKKKRLTVFLPRTDYLNTLTENKIKRYRLRSHVTAWF